MFKIVSQVQKSCHQQKGIIFVIGLKRRESRNLVKPTSNPFEIYFQPKPLINGTDFLIQFSESGLK